MLVEQSIFSEIKIRPEEQIANFEFRFVEECQIRLGQEIGDDFFRLAAHTIAGVSHVAPLRFPIIAVCKAIEDVLVEKLALATLEL
jgi:hypothetical protein